jgi:EpsI family protein
LYWIAGHVTSNDYVAKAWLAWSKMIGRGDDSALIAVYEPADDAEASSQRAARRFAADMSPAIERALAAARQSGR